MAENDPTLPTPDPGELLARAMHTDQPSGAAGGGRWTPPTPEELAELLPQFRIDALLGHGGMGAVYRGMQVALDRKVAIKLLPIEISTDPAFTDRFVREAKTLAKLSHPNIVAVHDFGTTSQGHLYFVMEFVEGTDLHKMIHGPGLSPAQSLSIIIAVCEALQYAHGKGVVHRDIKPANVMVSTEGTVKVADFGLARLNTPDTESDGLTMTGTVMGTLAYMAPEQTRGMRVDQRADIYSLGVMLYEMLCGEVPRGVFDPPSHKVQVDVRLDEVVLKAMHSEPERRYQNTGEMKTDVDRIRATPPKVGKGKKPETGRSQGGTPAPQRRKTLAIAAAALALLALLGIAGWLVFGKKEQRVADAGPVAPDWSKAVDLLALFRPEDGVSGAWSLQNGRLVSDQFPHARAELPYIPPEEYDYRMVFSYQNTKLPSGEASQFLSKGGRAFRWVMGANGGKSLGFETIAGKNAADGSNPTVKSRPPLLTPTATHTSLVEVRNDGIKAWLDGELVAEWRTDFTDMGAHSNWLLRNPQLLGVGSYQTALMIEKLEVREVTGKGTITRPPLTTGTSTPANATKDRPVRLIDLIALVDVQRDRLKAEGNAGANQWTKNVGQLAFASVDKRAGKIAAPVALNGLRDYEVELGVPTATADPIILDLPMSVTNQATVAFVPGQVVLMRDGNTSKEFGTWPKDATSPPWKLAARVKFDADGINGTISATINGASVGEWRGALGKLGKATEPHPDFPGQLVPALYVRSGDRAHSSWTLRVFDGQAKVLRGSIAAVSPSPSLPVSSSPAEPWRDALADLKIVGGDGKAHRNSEGLLLMKETAGTIAGTGRRNGAVRVQAVRKGTGSEVTIHVRSNGPGGRYHLSLSPDQQVRLTRAKAETIRAATLKDFPLPAPIQPGETYSMELRVVGGTLTASVNGVVLGTVEDSTLAEGDFGVGLKDDPSVLIRALEFLPLPEDRTAPPATASNPIHTFAGHRYQFVPGALRWTDAKAKAQEMGGHLATITSAEEASWIYATFGSKLDPSLRSASIWTGGFAAASGQPWKWVTGEPFTFTDWNKGEPDYSLTPGQPEKGPFGMAIKNHGKLRWFDDPVDRKNANAGFLVEWDDAGEAKSAAEPNPVQTFAGHRYQFVPGKVTWDEARANAEAMGGHLATITTKEEAEWIYTAFKPHFRFAERASRTWIGAYTLAADQPWHWVTNEPFDFADWMEGHPQTGYTKTPKARYAAGIYPYQLKWVAIVPADKSTVGFLVEWDDADGAPAMAAGEAWVPMFNRPVDSAEDAKLQEVDGWVIRKPGGVGGGFRHLGVKWRDAAIRADFRWPAEKSDIGLRDKDDNRYSLSRGKTGVQLRLKSTAGEAAVLQEYSVAEPREGEVYRLELRAVGSALVAKLDGREIIRLKDERLDAGAPAIVIWEGGGMRNIEVLNLDKSAAATEAAPFTLEQWKEFFPNPLEPGNEQAMKVADGLLYIKMGGTGLLKPVSSPDASIRVVTQLKLTTDSPTLVARQSFYGGYSLLASVAQSQLLLIHHKKGTGTDRTELATAPLPAKVGDRISLELRVEGNHLIGLVNGVVAMEARDDRIKAPGTWGIRASKGAWFESVEIVEIPPGSAAAQPDDRSAASPGGTRSVVSQTSAGEGGEKVGADGAAPSKATKDAPFVNTLGMKFVPVPITGGPTDGQRVLFSVWETRLQDFRAFWKDTKNTESITANVRKSGEQSWAVSWEDATAFCAWLTDFERKAGKLGPNERYRLPSDHEWSCAVGIGDREDPALTPAEKSKKLENVFPWGSAWPPPAGTGNYAGEEVRDLVGKDDWKIDGFIAGYTDAYKFNSPPGSFPPNALGLYDLGGNLSELCEDWVDGAKRFRVARGGSWISRDPRYLSSSHRNVAAPTTSSRTLGFRVVLAPVVP